MPAILEVDSVSKSFRTGLLPWRGAETRAVRSVSFSLREGEVLGLLGENGAGKTTLLKLLAGLLSPDTGTITIDGRPSSRDTRSALGLASGDERSLFLRLTGRRNLDFFASLYGLDPGQRSARIADLVEQLDLGDFIDRRVDRCSTGMRARLGLARSMLHEPRALLLDEPTKSLDPSHAELVRGALRRRADAGNAILLVTHDRDEAARIADRCLLMRSGQLEPAGDAK